MSDRTTPRLEGKDAEKFAQNKYLADMEAGHEDTLLTELGAITLQDKFLALVGKEQKKQNITDRELAVKMNISTKRLYDILTSNEIMTMTDIFKFRMALGKEIEFTLTEFET